MGEDYTGTVTVAPADGTNSELANYEIWSQSDTIMEMVKDTDPRDTIPRASVTKDGLNKVVEYMEMMAKFKADGTREDDKEATIDTYKKSLVSPVPLFFQTMVDATFMGVKTLIDELSEHLVSGHLTSEQIRDNLHLKVPTPDQEADLIETYLWIDPEGLIAKYRAAAADKPEAELPEDTA